MWGSGISCFIGMWLEVGSRVLSMSGRFDGKDRLGGAEVASFEVIGRKIRRQYRKWARLTYAYEVMQGTGCVRGVWTDRGVDIYDAA